MGKDHMVVSPGNVTLSYFEIASRETSSRDPEDGWDEIERENKELEKRGIEPLIPSGSVPPQPKDENSPSEEESARRQKLRRKRPGRAPPSP